MHEEHLASFISEYRFISALSLFVRQFDSALIFAFATVTLKTMHFIRLFDQQPPTTTTSSSTSIPIWPSHRSTASIDRLPFERFVRFDGPNGIFNISFGSNYSLTCNAPTLKDRSRAIFTQPIISARTRTQFRSNQIVLCALSLLFSRVPFCARLVKSSIKLEQYANRMKPTKKKNYGKNAAQTSASLKHLIINRMEFNKWTSENMSIKPTIWLSWCLRFSHFSSCLHFTSFWCFRWHCVVEVQSKSIERRGKKKRRKKCNNNENKTEKCSLAFLATTSSAFQIKREK